MKKPKVLFFMMRTSSEQGQITGGTWSELHIIGHLKKYDPFVVINRKDLLTSKLDELGIPYKIVVGENPYEGFGRKNFVAKIKTIAGLLFYNFKIWKIMREVNPEVVHCSELGSLMVFLGTKFAGKKLVIYVRNSFRGNRLRLVYKIPMLFSDSIVAISKEIASFIQDKGGRALRCKVSQIYNSVDIQSIDEFKKLHTKIECRTNLGIPIDHIAVGVIAAIEGRKRQKDFLENVVKYFAEESNLTFYFVGGVKDYDYYVECKRIIDELGLINAKFVGFQPNIYEWYRALDVVCLPSEREGVPRAIIEASAFELPVIAFNIAGCREAVLNNVTGFLVDTFEEFVVKLQQLVGSKELRDRLGNKGYQYVQWMFNVERNTSRLEALYSNLKKQNK